MEARVVGSSVRLYRGVKEDEERPLLRVFTVSFLIVK